MSATGEAATYQRLRAHLSFLKLPAAAESLPGMLDAARAEERSTVTVLEQLLAVEVATTQARRLASRCGSRACQLDPLSRTSTSPPSPASTRN